MEYLNKNELIAFLKSRCFTEETKNGCVLALSPTVIDEIKEMKGIII